MHQNYYEFLGTTPMATNKELKELIRKKKEQVSVGKYAKENIKELTKIQKTLLDYHNRRNYDEEMIEHKRGSSSENPFLLLNMMIQS